MEELGESARCPGRVVVVDDHALVLDSVAKALETAGWNVVATASSFDEALTQLRLQRPDVALVDVDLSADRDGLDLVEQVHAELPDCRVLIVSMHDDDRTLRRAVALGIEGFVTKDAPLAELLGAVRAVAEGESYLSNRLAGRILALAGSEDPAHQPLLTPREMEVLRLLARGQRPQDIAEELFLAPKTVKNHLTGVYAKLGVATAAQAVAEAYRRGFVGQAGTAG